MEGVYVASAPLLSHTGEDRIWRSITTFGTLWEKKSEEKLDKIPLCGPSL